MNSDPIEVLHELEQDGDAGLTEREREAIRQVIAALSTQQSLTEAQAVAPSDGSPFDMAMREYEAAAIKCGDGWNNTWELDAAAKRVFALYNAKTPSAPEAQPVPVAPVGVEVVRRVAENIRANLDSLPSIARVWADDLDQALAQKPVAVDGAATNSAVAAIQFALTDPEGMTFLRLWNEGEFDTLRREWPDAPSEVYVGADPLAAQQGGEK